MILNIVFMEYYLDEKGRLYIMLLNPFITVKHTKNIYYFFEKYTQTQKPFLTLKTLKEFDELISNKQLNQRISEHLQYSFAILENQKELFSMLEENVALCSTLVNKIMLAKFLMLRLHETTIQLQNFSSLELENLKNMLEVNFGYKSKIVVIIYEKNRCCLEHIPLLSMRDLVLIFEVCEGELVGVGPFIEIDTETTQLSHYFTDKKVEKNLVKIKEYWNRPIEEVIFDTTISAVTDYFSDYITASSPFMYRKVVVNEDSLYLCENFSLN